MANTSTPSTPTVILRKKRPAPVTPSIAPQSTVKPSQSPAVVSGKPQKNVPTGKPALATSAASAPGSAMQSQPHQTPAPSGYNHRQRRNYEQKQRLLQSPDFLQISAAMVARWPHLFQVTPETIRPLAIGIANDLCAQLSDFDPKLVHQTLRQWMADHRVPYWKALMRGGPRYDLDGNPKGEVTTEQQEAARQQRKAWFERREQRHKPRVNTALAPSGDTPQEESV